MSKTTPCSTAAVAAVVWVLVASTLLLLAPPASAARAVGTHGHGGHQCNPLRDILVNQTAGAPQSDGTKQFDVVVTNEGLAVVRDVHLDCGYRFRSLRAVDPSVLVQARPGDCLLIDGSAIAPGARVSFTYASYVRYTMAVVNATCTHR